MTSDHIETYHLDDEVGTDCEHSLGSGGEYEPSDGGEYDSDEKEGINNERRRVVDDRLENYKELKLGMSFKDMNEGRKAVNFYALANKKALKLIKCETVRTRWGCQEGCLFRCLISEDGKTGGFTIKTWKDIHTCDDAFKNPRADATTLAQYFKSKVQNNPKYTIKDMRGELEHYLKLNVSRSKLKRAKNLVLQKLEGSFIDDYNKLEAYCQELRLSNPGSDVVINISKDALAEGKRNFLRMYLCFNALKQGWKNGLRPLIGVDGTFLKGRTKGQLLVALGQDSMNHFYPLAWAVVDKETSSTVLPEANHRYCVRHIEANWCKKWRSGEMRKLLWWCAWSSYDEEFKDQLKKLGDLSEDAAKDILKLWDLSGIPCPHAIKAMMHKRVEPGGEIHWWYSKEAYLLTYKEKLQPVRGRQFWKVEPSQAMLPPDTVKQVGRPKVKRNREPDEARKRIGEWSQSRKGTQMTCSNCGEPNHNARGCYKPKAAATQEDAAMESDNEDAATQEDAAT
ncbi:PREDICTED: uncharacterized protein LOC109234687 [Nicotiana attenuata]|uniref:uncharacterized protein LOC109234687 n=1 Tax=Nicotiana attenuata TaxID=49451 RepID=UPI00090578C4|nr:PREDICTED: uncharacterized protein LOC109234687 [Nicotiana attenuata]